MGKGDKKTRRGKIGIGTFGRLRPRKKSKAAATLVTPKAKATTKAKVAAPKAKPVAKKTTAKKPVENKVEEEE